MIGSMCLFVSRTAFKVLDSLDGFLLEVELWPTQVINVSSQSTSSHSSLLWDVT